jgi:tetratricopeptide (TPR) repeat protein
MVCGRPPFLGDDNIAIIGQHINTPPVAPTWHRSDCPRPLEALIMRLMAKNPSERPENASDVLAALEAVDLSPSEQSINKPEQSPEVLDSLAGDVFVGRHQEMDDLKAALEDTLGGRGRMVTLVGEPGIGKTRTARELATYAGLRGAQVLWGRCYEEQGVPPYWPWVQAIRDYAREKTPEELTSVMGSGASEIAEVVSDVRTKLPGLPKPTPMDSPEAARFRLFDSISTFLRNASIKQPIMLVLDDLQWSDRPSLVLLQFLVREMGNSRILLVGTYRDVELNRQHPLSETLGDLNRESQFQRVLLRGLTRDDVGRFIEIVSGFDAPESLVSTVHTQTEGNPLFVTEIVRHLVQEGELTQEHVRTRESWEIRVPEGVREVIGRRLNRLSERCNETLTIAACIGREFNLEQLGSIINDLNQDMLLDVLEEALATKLIEELPTSVGLYQFTHALMQEALITELSLTRRVRLHAQIAQSLESLYGGEAESHAAQLVHHFSQAETLLGTQKLVRYSMAAGKQALEGNAYEDALPYFETASSSIHDGTPPQEAGQILFDLGRSQSAVGQLSVAFQTLKRAYDFFVRSGNQNDAVTVAVYPHTVYGSEVITFLEGALDLVSSESREAAHIISRLGISYAVEGQMGTAQESYEKALSIARQEGDIGFESMTLTRYATLEWQKLNIHKARELLETSLRLPRETGNLLPEHQIHLQMSFCCNIAGDSTKALEHAEQCTVIAERLNDWIRLAQALMVRQLAHLVVGDWSKTQSYTFRSLEGAYHVAFVSRLICAEFQIGNFSRGHELIDEMAALVNSGAGSMTDVQGGAHIALAGMVINDDSIIEIAESVAQKVLDSSGSEMGKVLARMSQSLIAVHRQDKPLAQIQYDHFNAHRGLCIEAISIDRLLGLLARTLGNFEVSNTHFIEAVTFCRKAGYRPELAWSLHDYAEMLVERDEPGDSEKATSMLDEALQISTNLGMRPLMERVLSKRDILKA